MNVFDWVALALVLVGAINWGLVGMGNLFLSGTSLNIVNILLPAIFENIVYLVVGGSGVYLMIRMLGEGMEE